MKFPRVAIAADLPFLYMLVSMGASLALSLFVGVHGFAATPYVRLVASAIPSLAILAMLSGTKMKLPFVKGSLMAGGFFLLAVFNVIYLIIGLLRHNSSLYVITDFVYLVFFPLGYCVGVWVYRMHAQSLVFARIYKQCILLSIVGLSVAMVGSNASADFFLLSMAIALVCLLRRNYLALVILLVLGAPHAANLSRGYLLAVVSIFIFVMLAVRAKRALPIALALTLSGIVGVIAYTQSDSLRGGQLERRVDETRALVESSGREVSLPLRQRMYERDVVYTDLQQGFVLTNMLLGMGHGYTFDMSGSEDSSVRNSQLMGDVRTHNIHMLHVALLARFGLIGSFVLAVVVFVALFRLRGILKGNIETMGGVPLVAGFFVVALVAFSIPASSFLLSSALFSYFCGIIDAAASPKARDATRAGAVKCL